mmetsp:Transcript_137112/g.438438  ORF Transcript_137112/g.438438 Transcript_137112/m.438438 type:complete len:225 (-) Transcript_137112:124-798(-)
MRPSTWAAWCCSSATLSGRKCCGSSTACTAVGRGRRGTRASRSSRRPWSSTRRSTRSPSSKARRPGPAPRRPRRRARRAQTTRGPSGRSRGRRRGGRRARGSSRSPPHPFWTGTAPRAEGARSLPPEAPGWAWRSTGASRSATARPRSSSATSRRRRRSSSCPPGPTRSSTPGIAPRTSGSTAQVCSASRACAHAWPGCRSCTSSSTTSRYHPTADIAIALRFN